jgi:hypothetical protein
MGGSRGVRIPLPAESTLFVVVQFSMVVPLLQ